MATVTEDAVKAAYDARFADAAPSTEYNASHLLVETEEEALAAKARIDAGEDFADRCAKTSQQARLVQTAATLVGSAQVKWFLNLRRPCKRCRVARSPTL